MRFLQEELRIQVRLGDRFMVDDRERANTCQDEVLRYLICEGFHGDKKDVRLPNPTRLLGVFLLAL